MDDVTPTTGACNRVATIKPAAIYSYVDSLTLWFKPPLPRAKQPEWLNDAITQRRAYVRHERLTYKPEYRQRLQLRQPSEQELRWLAKRSDTLITRVECALDWTFNDPCEVLNAQDVVDAYWVKRWHR